MRNIFSSSPTSPNSSSSSRKSSSWKRRWKGRRTFARWGFEKKRKEGGNDEVKFEYVSVPLLPSSSFRIKLLLNHSIHSLTHASQRPPRRLAAQLAAPHIRRGAELLSELSAQIRLDEAETRWLRRMRQNRRGEEAMFRDELQLLEPMEGEQGPALTIQELEAFIRQGQEPFVYDCVCIERKERGYKFKCGHHMCAECLFSLKQRTCPYCRASLITGQPT
jgi:hypothetical protein